MNNFKSNIVIMHDFLIFLINNIKFFYSKINNEKQIMKNNEMIIMKKNLIILALEY